MNDSYYIDIRAIHMTKSTTENSILKFAEDNVSQTNAYICLGHFDTMQINEIYNFNDDKNSIDLISNPLKVLRDYVYKQAKQPTFTENNTHILYIIKQVETEDYYQQQRKFQHFWNIKSNYTVISRFHCDALPDDNKPMPRQDFICELEKRCVDGKRSSNVSFFGHVVDGFITEDIVFHVGNEVETSVNAIFYDSLDLGDIIGIFKGSSLRAILELQRHISETPIVSDDYTYCGISTRLLGLKQNELQNELKKQSELGKLILPYISTRFSIKLARDAYRYLSSFQDYKKYYVLGNEDVVLMFKPHNEAKFLLVIKQLVDTGTSKKVSMDTETEENKSIDAKSENVSIYTAFHDVITRVGLAYTKPFGSRTEDVSPMVVITSKEMESIIVWDSKPGWLPSLVKLLSAHKAMSENCVTDDLSLLVSPSVKALIQRIQCLKSTWRREYDNEICTFLSAWSSLTEEIYRVENQLSQHPELSPPQSYIPATLLLYDLALVINYEDLLWLIDGVCCNDINKKHRNYAPILTPSFTSETSTLCILDPKQDSSYTSGAPLVIQLPIHDLYQPWKMMHILIHELSHYCGESIRDRAKRWECIRQCVTEYILVVWDYYLDYNKLVTKENTDESTHKKTHAKFRSIINSRITNSYKSFSTQIYLSDIQQYLPGIATRIACDYDLQLEYRCTLLENAKANLSEQLRNIHENGRTTAMELGAALQTRISEHITKCIVPLFKECFADIVMILLLDCSLDDYYMCVYKDEYTQLFPNGISCEDNLDSTMRQICEKHTDRLAIVTTVLQGIKGNWAQGNCRDPWVCAAKEKVDYYCPKENVGDCQEQKPKWKKHYTKTIGTYVLAVGEVDKIHDYLLSCAASINEALSNPEINKRKEELATELGNSKDGKFNWNRMHDYIKASKDFINEWCRLL